MIYSNKLWVWCQFIQESNVCQFEPYFSHLLQILHLFRATSPLTFKKILCEDSLNAHM